MHIEKRFTKNNLLTSKINSDNFLKTHKDELKGKYSLVKIGLFGSYARGEAEEESDVDIAIISMKEKNYFTLISAMQYLEEKLHKKVDLGFFDSIRPFVKKKN